MIQDIIKNALDDFYFTFNFMVDCSYFSLYSGWTYTHPFNISFNNNCIKNNSGQKNFIIINKNV